jgi:hypothetical protein
MNALLRKSLPATLVTAYLMGGSAPAWTLWRSGSPAPSGDPVHQARNPVDGFSWGVDVRLRNDSLENPYLNQGDPPGHEFSFERLRLREWNTLRPGQGFEVTLRFTWEGRHYWKPDSKEEWDESEIVVDNFHGKFTFPEARMALTVGRQDIVFGEGWLVSDGTPLDGPRTTYFDAVRASLDLKEIQSTLDLILIDQASSPNRWLRPVSSKGKPLMEQDERGAIAYFSNKSLVRTQIDAYFIYKHDQAVLPNGDTGEVFTGGTSISHGFNSGFSSRIESAYQFGRRKNAVMFPQLASHLSAWGFNGRLTYSFRDSSKRQAWLGCEVLSGNDAHDTHNRQFDPLWGRWAKYSELFPDDLDRTGDRSNLKRINLGYQFEPAPGTLFQANYHALFAFAHRYSATPGFSAVGTFKGHLLTAILRYQLNQAWSGYFLGEYFIPGNYYALQPGNGPLGTRKDPAAFLRTEIIFRF